MTIPIEAYRLKTGFLSLKQGLHCIRYEAASNPTEAPFVLISAVPDHASLVQMFSSRDGEVNALRAPGDVLIIKAAADVNLIITTAASGSFTATPPELQIERLDRATFVPDVQKTFNAAERLEIVGLGPSSSNTDGRNLQPAAEVDSNLSGSGKRQGNVAVIKIHAEFVDGSMIPSSSITDFPQIFTKPVRRIRFIAPAFYLGERLLKLTAYLSDGRIQHVKGLDLSAEGSESAILVGFRLREQNLKDGTTRDLLVRLLPSAEMPKPETSDLRPSKAFIRRRSQF